MGAVEYLTEVEADEPHALWSLNGVDTYVDQSGNGFDASPAADSAAPTVVETDGPDPGLGYVSYDGTDDYSSHTTLGSFASSLITGAWTWEAWVRTTASTYEVISGSVNTGTSVIFDVVLNGAQNGADSTLLHNHTLFIRTPSDRSLVWSFTSEDLCDGEWHHLVWASTDFAGSDVRAYVDGVDQVATKTRTATPGTMVDFDFPLTYGARNLRGSIASHYTGDLAYAALYSTALAAERVAAHHRAMTGRVYDTPLYVAGSGVGTLWKASAATLEFPDLGQEVGDLMVMVVHRDRTDGGNNWLTPPSEWQTGWRLSTGSGPRWRFECYWWIKDSGATGETVTGWAFPGGNDYSAWFGVFRHVDPSDPVRIVTNQGTSHLAWPLTSTGPGGGLITAYTTDNANFGTPTVSLHLDRVFWSDPIQWEANLGAYVDDETFSHTTPTPSDIVGTWGTFAFHAVLVVNPSYEIPTGTDARSLAPSGLVSLTTAAVAEEGIGVAPIGGFPFVVVSKTAMGLATPVGGVSAGSMTSKLSLGASIGVGGSRGGPLATKGAVGLARGTAGAAAITDGTKLGEAIGHGVAGAAALTRSAKTFVAVAHAVLGGISSTSGALKRSIVGVRAIMGVRGVTRGRFKSDTPDMIRSQHDLSRPLVTRSKITRIYSTGSDIKREQP